MKLLATLFGTFFISFNASLGIRKSKGVEELDRVHKFMMKNKGTGKRKGRYQKKYS